MRTEKHLALHAALMLPLALLLTQCSDSEPQTSEETIDAMDQAGQTGAPVVDADVDNAGTDANYSPNGMPADPATTNADGSALTPAQERASTVSHMQGLRATLVADLERVRSRLNDGTDPDPLKEADQALAADLAQGLERVDRALAAMDVSTDATWASIREVQMKEVADVRAWMVEYRSRSTSAKAQ